MLCFIFVVFVQLCSCSFKIKHSQQTAVSEVDITYYQKKLGSLSGPYFEDYHCSNISPNQKSCYQIELEGGCGLMDFQYCKLSCKTCCYDIAPGEIDCQGVPKINGCDYFVERGYCLNSCNACHRLKEIYALNALKTSIQYPEQLSTWQGWDPCYPGWDGVVCENNRVSELRLGISYFDFNLNKWFGDSQILRSVVTTIPSQLSCLENLTGLWIEKVGFRGHLPPELSALDALKAASFAQQSLSGSIPPQYSTWSKFLLLNAWNNKFTSTIPAQFAIWSNIYFFDITGNKFTGEVPIQLSTWSSIESFYVCEGDGNVICVPDDFKGYPKIENACPSC